jgi:hypothetical protein
MPAFEIRVTLPDGSDDIMLVERETRKEAEAVALQAFGPGTQLNGSGTEVPTVTYAPDGEGDGRGN